MPGDANIWPRFEELDQTLSAWADAHADKMALAVEGRSPEGRPVYGVSLTDPDADAEEKQHVVLSAVHTGGERSAAATLFGLMEWLLSEDPEAAQVLMRQKIVCLPILHPDGYVKGRLGEKPSRHGLMSNGWGLQGVTEPAKAPEAVALQEVLDRLKPELYADVHGISLDFEGQLMLESSASSPSRITSRPYRREIARIMDEAALQEGFASDFHEDDREEFLWGPGMAELDRKFWWGRSKWSPALYAYANYHTLAVVMEIAWQRSGVARLKRLLRVGNEQWPGERDAGYPTRVVHGGHPSGMYQMVVPYGNTAALQRTSRAELWSRHGQIASAILDPQRAGKTAGAFTTSADAYRQSLEGHESVGAFVERLSPDPRINGAYLRAFFRGWPAGQNRPEPAFAVSNRPEATACRPIERGIAFRLRIPFERARIEDVRLNGHALRVSSTDGYTEWRARGFTFVQAHVPPSVAREESLFVLTCQYDPGEQREYWRVPEA